MTPPFGAAHLAISPEAALSPAASSGGDEFPIKSRDIADEAQISKASSILESAKNVFILVGVGVEIAGAQTALLEFAEMWGVPVAVTPKAKGHFPESHPLFAGCFTAYGDQALRDALESADLILGVGLDGVDFVTSFWEIKTPLVNLSPGRALDSVTNPLVAINGNLATLLGEFADLRSNSPHGEKLAQDLRRKIGQALQTNHIRVSGRTRIIPFIQDLRAVVPPDGIVTVDVGVFKLVFLQAWETDFPKTLFVANGLSAMGYAIPGAIALKLANPQGTVIAIVGDGALHMYTGELATLARLGLPIVVLIIVDQAYALIRLKQHRYEVPVYGTEFQATDYAALAKAYGLDYRLIDGEDHTKTILHKALMTHSPILVEVRIDVTEYDHFK
jgi:acetolactate synthase-1/2/3 large subunit